MATGSSIISALSAGSGVDVSALAQSLVDVERIPREEAIQAKITREESRIAGYSALMVALDSLKSAYEKLNDQSEFVAGSVTSSASSLITAQVGASASPGVHTIAVSQMAQSQVTVSAGYAATNTALNGASPFSLSITLGGVVQEPIRVSTATPAGVVAAINQAGLSVTAKLVDNGASSNPYQIVLEGESGASAAFSVSSDDGSGAGEEQTITFGAASASGTVSIAGVEFAVDGDETGAELAALASAALVAAGEFAAADGRSVTDNGDGTLTLAWAASDGDVSDVEISVGTSGATITGAVTTAFVAGASVSDLALTNTVQAASDLSATVDGLPISRSSNEITGVIDGVTVEVTDDTVANGPVTLSVKADTAAIKQNVLDLVDAYNQAVSDIDILTGEPSDDPEDIYSGSLRGDSAVDRIKRQLRSMLTGDSSTASGDIQAMRDIGLDIDRFGVASIDETVLSGALADQLDDVTQFFSAGTNAQTNYGVAARGAAGDAVKQLTDWIANRGTILTNSENAQSKIIDYQSQLEQLSLRMEALLLRYTKQFAAMESFVGNANSTRTSLESTFEGLMSMYTKK